MSNNLADYFRSQADWRDLKAEEYPDDPRNEQSAAALRSLAEYVESDEREAVAAARAFDPAELGAEEVRRVVARYGYGHTVTDGSHEEFLHELVALCVQRAYEAVSEHASDDDPSGMLHGFEVEAAREGVRLAPQYFSRRAGALPEELEAWVQEARDALV
jgi:hypothetical protein